MRRPTFPAYRALRHDQHDACDLTVDDCSIRGQSCSNVVNTYLAPNKSLPELRDMVNSGAVDPLRDFSEACREEFQKLQHF